MNYVPAWINQLYSDLEKCQDEHSRRLLSFAINDYACLWNALALQPENAFDGRGNYVFAKQAMLFLELVCRMTRRSHLEKFSASLKARNEDYFFQMAFMDYRPRGKAVVLSGTIESSEKVYLPYESAAPKQPILLWLLFDLVRNGMAHQAEQISLTVNKTEKLVVGMTGVQHNGTLDYSETNRKFVRIRCTRAGTDFQLTVFPEALFLDFCFALLDSGIFLAPDFKISLINRSCDIEPSMWNVISKELVTQLKVR